MGVAVRQTAILSIVAVAATVIGLPIAAHAQVTCAPGTGTVVRAVGPQTAPMLVPASVPLTICSQNGSVVAVIPSFRTVGPASAPMIIPVSTPVRTCAPAATVVTPVVGSGFAPQLQFVQVGTSVVIVNGGTTATPLTPVVIASVPTVFTCF